MTLEVARNCLVAERRQHHPCAAWLRPAAAAEAWVIKLASEAGRLCGHARRGAWRGMCRSIDWFFGMDAGVVRGEQWRMAVRCAVCTAAAALAALVAASA